MKLAYVTTYDASDLNAWSGAPSFMLKALRGCEIEAEVLDNISEGPLLSLLERGKTAAYRKLLGRNYQRDRSPAVVRRYAAEVARGLRSSDADIVFSPGTLPIACLETDKPIAFWTDATFAGMLDFYPGFSRMCPETVRNGNRVEQLALSRCRVAIYSSDWAAQTALQHYQLDPSKVKVVPFGANLDARYTLPDIIQLAQRRPRDVCKLLFVGVEWARKGGDMALAVARMLNQRGLRTELHVVGCTPPGPPPSFVTLHGFLSKNTEAGRLRLETLMSESHFLIVPSQAECYGLVFAEASSFGLPSIATRTGGIPTAVRDGRNGMTFALDAGPQPYCDYIEALMASASDYQALCRSTFLEYAERLNWGAAARQVRTLLQQYCQ